MQLSELWGYSTGWSAENLPRYIGVIATGVYAALFRTGGAFYDLARPDALYLFLVFLGVITIYYAQRWQAITAGAIVFVIAFYTKQTSAVFVPLSFSSSIGAMAARLLFGTVTFGLAWVIGYQINQSTGGWFWFYIFEGHQGHLFYWKNILLEYWRDLICLARCFSFFHCFGSAIECRLSV